MSRSGALIRFIVIEHVVAAEGSFDDELDDLGRELTVHFEGTGRERRWMSSGCKRANLASDQSAVCCLQSRTLRTWNRRCGAEGRAKTVEISRALLSLSEFRRFSVMVSLRSPVDEIGTDGASVAVSFDQIHQKSSTAPRSRSRAPGQSRRGQSRSPRPPDRNAR